MTNQPMSDEQSPPMNNDLPDEAINRRIAELDGWTSVHKSQKSARLVGTQHRDGKSLAGCFVPDYLNDYEAAVRAWEKLIPEWVAGPSTGGTSDQRWCASLLGGAFPAVFAPTFPRVICLAIIHQHGAQ